MSHAESFLSLSFSGSVFSPLQYIFLSLSSISNFRVLFKQMFMCKHVVESHVAKLAIKFQHMLALLMIYSTLTLANFSSQLVGRGWKNVMTKRVTVKQLRVQTRKPPFLVPTRDLLLNIIEVGWSCLKFFLSSHHILFCFQLIRLFNLQPNWDSPALTLKSNFI